MYSPQNYVEKPLNLLTFDSLGHAILNKQTLELIESIPKPISILAIAGPYRTGKSFLLNSLVAGSGVNLGESQKFQVSSTTRSCTKGLWIWGKPLTSVDENGKITNVLIIDTEGFGSVHEVHDKRIIILALLLSTCFVYNSKGLIDGDSLKDLQYVIQQTKKVKRQLCFDSVTDFHWILRDFHYQLVNQLGFQISSDQYMENSFKQFCDTNSQNRQLFGLLCDFFRNRSCHTFLTPQTNPSVEQNPQFTNQLLKFKKILNRIPSLNLDGLVLGQIIQAYVSAMNQNCSQNGVYREGAQCRLRITCLSQLCKELEHILLQETQQKRMRLIKMALNDVEDSFISKMTSEKQIKILKEQVHMLISQFESVSAPTTSKNIKIRQARQPRQSISLPKIRQPRSSTQPNQFGSELEIRNSRNSARVQMAAIQKIREELQAKIHRYELQLTQHITELTQLKTINQQLSTANNKLQEQLHEITNTAMTKQREHALAILEMYQKIEQIRKQYTENYSQLQKNNELLLQKQAYLQSKIAETQIFTMERQSGLAKRYKQRIKQLQKQLQDMRVRHQTQIEQVKQIYRCKDLPNQHQIQPEYNGNTNNFSHEAFKQYTDRIFGLEEQVSQLMIDRMQMQHKLSTAQTSLSTIKSTVSMENQLIVKKSKQKQLALLQFHSAQLHAKQKLIQEMQTRQQQQRLSYQEQIEAITKKSEQITHHLQNLLKDSQQQIKKLQDQCVEACERYQIQNALRVEKEREIEKLIEEMEYQRSQQSKNYDSSFESQKLLREELLANKKQVGNLSDLLQTSKKCEQELHTELNNQKQAHKSHIEDIKNFHHLEISRLQNKIVSLSNNNSYLKQANNRLQDFQSQIGQLQQQKQQKIKELQHRHEQITNLQKEIDISQIQNDKLSRLAQELTEIIKNHNKELEDLADKNNAKLEEKQTKIIEIISKMHSKQKQCYILNERLQSARKQIQNNTKQSQKLINDRLQQKNAQITKLTKNLQSSQSTLSQLQIEHNRLSQRYSLLQQRHQHLEQMLQSQVTDAKERANREVQRMSGIVMQLQTEIKKISQDKIQTEKMIRIYENDARETINTIADMKRKYEKNVQSYEANIKLMRKKSIELDVENRQLKDKLTKIQKKLQCIQMSKQLLQQNYNEDFKLWCSKFEVLEKQRSLKRSISNCQLTNN